MAGGENSAACDLSAHADTLSRWKMAAASCAKYHRERARFGVAVDFHTTACAFLEGVVPDVLDELAALRARRVEEPRAVRVLWERVQELEARLRSLGVEGE